MSPDEVRSCHSSKGNDSKYSEVNTIELLLLTF